MVSGTQVNPKIDCQTYFQDVDRALCQVLFIKEQRYFKVDCIVATKWSGLMMGAYFSNKLNVPMFITSEIPSIPLKMKNCLLVDDKIWHGRQFRKYTRKLQESGKRVTTACLYIEGIEKLDIYVEDIGSKVHLFYER